MVIKDSCKPLRAGDAVYKVISKGKPLVAPLKCEIVAVCNRHVLKVRTEVGKIFNCDRDTVFFNRDCAEVAIYALHLLAVKREEDNEIRKRHTQIRSGRRTGDV